VRYGCGGGTALAIFERPMEAIDRSGASSGAVAELELAQIARVDNYLDREKALEAAGLSEWAMSRKRRSSSRRGPPPGRIGPQPRFGTK
jgi:hypothetical protein